MQKHNLVQGSQEWHEYRAKHFNASDAPAMLGISQYKTRSKLLQEMATGISQEFDAATERRFADGHRFEALARPIAEQIIGADLYPITASEGKLSASFDGLTLDETICFEHKTLNKNKLGEGIAEEYRAQMEQQLMISGAEKCLFMASKWDENDVLIEERHAYYVSDQDMRDRIVQGWVQFAKDLENYQHVEVIPAAVAAPTKDLPALSIQVNGSISLISNLEKFGAQLNSFVEQIDKEPTDDQGFANAEAAIKTLQNAQDALEAAESNALAQTSDIDDMRKTVKLYADTARTTRLMLEKMVKARKESLRVDIVSKAGIEFSAHVEGLESETRPIQLNIQRPDFAAAIKGKKNLLSMHEAIDTMLRDGKYNADIVAKDVRVKLAWCKENAAGHSALFPDLQNLMSKPLEDFTLTITSRIEKLKAGEAARLEAERARMQAEATEKAEREAAAKLAEQEAAIRAEERAKAEAEIREEKETLKKYEKTENLGESIPVVKQSLTTEPAKVVGIRKPSRPSHAELIQFVANNFSVSYGQACTWVIETAESLKVAA